MFEQLQHYLAHRQKKHISDPTLTPAAVLVPVYCKDDEYHLLFIRRSDTVQHHKGETSFPGGHFDHTDKTLLDTAIRECTEEIGLNPENIEVLGELDDAITVNSNYLITPFLACIPHPYKFTLQKWEVESLVEIPLQAFLEQNPDLSNKTTPDGCQLESYVYHYRQTKIWGATARILHDLLEILNRFDLNSSK
jgi:8-oxo-dGTP pyrophosphatase MutT (NUDIX family)